MGPSTSSDAGPDFSGKSVLCVEPSALSGGLKLPPSKSHAMRWLTLASMDVKPTKIVMWEIGKDVLAMIDCLEQLGIKWENDTIYGGELSRPSGILDCKNSGTALRFLIGQSATCDFKISIDGDASLRARSSLQLLDSLCIEFNSKQNTSELPIDITGPFNLQNIEIDVSKTSQFYSALMLMAPRTNGFNISTKGDAVSRNHSALTWELCQLTGARNIGEPWQVNCPDVVIPSDASMMSFAKLAGLEVTNAPSEKESIGHSLENSVLRDSNDLITPMAAWLALGKGGLISGAPHAAHKESNRITKTVEMLSRFGIKASANTDGIMVEGGQVPSRPDGIVETYGDHRMQMTAVLLARFCGAMIEGVDLHEVAWPSFLEQLKLCGLDVKTITI